MSSEARVIRWGIIGCGNVTEVKSGPGFQQAPHSALVAVMRRDGAKARDYAQRHGVPRWYDDAAALIADPEVDAVYVATPPSTHKQYALMSIAAGKPVYVEKPMALDHAECEAILRAGAEAKVPVFVAYYRRRLPRFLKIRELIASGTCIGTPRFVTCMLHRPLEARYRNPAELPWTVMPDISGGGLFVDLACHTLDILDFLFGEITSVRGHASSQSNAYPAEDCVSMSFLFRNGMHGCGMWNFASHERYDEVRVVGSEGQITFATFGDGDIVVTRPGEPEQRFAIGNPVHIQQPLIECVVRSLTGASACQPDLEPTHAARTSWVMDQVLNEYRLSQHLCA